MADDLRLQPGVPPAAIGPHKTGTTAVQGAFHLARERLVEARAWSTPGEA